MKPLTLPLLILALLASPATLAASNMKTINVDLGYYHIGDDNDPSFKNPAPEGTAYLKENHTAILCGLGDRQIS